jgi:hypothetical protein
MKELNCMITKTLSLSLSDPSNHDTSTIANMLGANQPCLDSIPISHRLENVASSLQDLPICMYKESASNSNESLVFCESTYKARTLQPQQGEQQVFVCMTRWWYYTHKFLKRLRPMEDNPFQSIVFSLINMEPLTLDDNVMHDAKVPSLALWEIASY